MGWWVLTFVILLNVLDARDAAASVVSTANACSSKLNTVVSSCYAQHFCCVISTDHFLRFVPSRVFVSCGTVDYY